MHSIPTNERALNLRYAVNDPGALLRNYLKLSKHRLSGLVAFTAGVGYAMRADFPSRSTSETKALSSQYLRKLGATTVGTWLTAACANTLNQMYEIRSDSLMGRTRARPLPSGRISFAHAALFATVTGISGLGILSCETNSTATALAGANILLYAGVYTPLKPISTINTWIGAVVGAIPPMLGWAAASDGNLLGAREHGAWVLGSLLFLWQIPHFHALAVVSRADYIAGGLKMLAVSNPVANATWAKAAAGAMLPLGALACSCGLTSPLFTVEAAALSAWMYKGALRMAAAPTSVAAARPLFRATIFHLPLTLSLMLFHRLPNVDSMVSKTTAQQDGNNKRKPYEVYLQQPWEVMAPFPFLPVPCGVPAVVYEGPHQSE